MVESSLSVPKKPRTGKRAHSTNSREVNQISSSSIFKLSVCVRMKPGGENEETKSGERIVDPSTWPSGIIKVDGASTGIKSFGPYHSVIGP